MSQDVKKIVSVLCGAFGLTLAIMGLVFLWFSRDSIMNIRPLWDTASEEDIIMEKIMVFSGAGFFVFGLILLIIALLYGRKKSKREKVGLSDTIRHGSPEFKKYMDDVVKKMPAEQKAEVMYLINIDRKLEAIKLFRDTTGIGLAHAKDAIDHYDIYLK